VPFKMTIAVVILLFGQAHAQSVSLPLKTTKNPATDLMDRTGRPLDVGEATALAERGQDLSLLNPQPNKFWQNQKYAAVQTQGLNYPVASVGVQFLSDEVQSLGTYMARVQSRNNPEVYFRMSLSRFSQSTLMRAALLRKLGYFIPSPQFYRNLRVFFNDEKEKETFLENDKQNHSLVLADAILEPASTDYFDIHWGFAPNPANPALRPYVERLTRNRAYRALILPYSLVDIPESINRYSPKFAAILSGHVVITHPSGTSFAGAGLEDVRWLARKMISWTPQDYREIVQAAGYPLELQSLVYAKMMARVNSMFESLNLSPAIPLDLPRLNINSESGLVKNGKVTQEFVPGYPQRFSHGDRESPIQDGDLPRYLNIQGKTSLLATAIGEFNKKLQLKTAQDAVEKRTEYIKKLIEDKSAEIVVVSLGADGAILVTKEETHLVKAPKVEKKSTVGAGDSMVGGMVWALSQNKTLKKVIQIGVCCGTAATMNEGTQLFKTEDVMKLFQDIEK